MKTTLIVDRANCPLCLTDTLDALEHVDGVRAVHGSVTGPCIEIDHDDVALDVLTTTVREHLHGIEMYANEVRMVPVEPVAAARPCTHRWIEPSMTLGEIVNDHPSLAAELERRHLDYCCHGDRTLRQAATASGLDPQAVARELIAARSAGERPAPWASLEPAALVDHIEATHHRYLDAALPRLGALVDKIVGVHGGRHPELAEVQRLFTELRADLEPHLRREEEVVFPTILALATGSGGSADAAAELAEQVETLLAEHETVGALLEDLHRVTSGYTTPADGCASYAACYRGLAELEADTHLHVHIENNVLLPAVRALQPQHTS